LKASPETKEKMSLNSFRKGKPSPMKGKTHTEATKVAISKKLRGEKNHTWKGGVTPENNIIRQSVNVKLWKLAVYERDFFTCRKCNQVGGKLQAHHIQNFSDFEELRCEVSNGITFCKKCHQTFHKKYTKLNNTIEQLNEYLQ
jgi:transcription elongation factor Elf1